MKTSDAAVAYAHEQRERFEAEYETFLRIPSISTDPAYAAEIQKAADWICTHMEEIGLDNCQIIQGDGHPVVYGDWLHAGPDKLTVLVYAHYDVQPVDPLSLWETPPFEPTVRDGRLYARGAFDDKSGVFINLKAVESLLKTRGSLPVNVKLFFEGEEETGSPSMAPFVRQYRDLLEADLLAVCDGSSPEEGPPRLMTAVRGMAGGEVFIRGPKRDVHSGQYGGGIHNPIHKAGEIIAALHDAEGRVQIPGFYDDVRELDAASRAALSAENEKRMSKLLASAGAKAEWGDPDYTFMERITVRPTCDVNGIKGGYQGEGGKTIIPSEASFKVTMRLVPGQDPQDIATKFRRFVESFASDTLEISVTLRGETPAAELLTGGPIIEAAARAFELSWREPPTLERSGGSIPIISMFQRELGMPMTILGTAVGGNIHSPNEYVVLEGLFRNIDTQIYFLENLAEIGETETR